MGVILIRHLCLAGDEGLNQEYFHILMLCFAFRVLQVNNTSKSLKMMVNSVSDARLPVVNTNTADMRNTADLHT